MLLYYVTDRKQLSPHHNQSLRLLLDQIAGATRAGVDLIQIREKDLSARALVELGTRAVEIVREGNTADPARPRTRLVINSRTDVAIACGADGVHLRANDISAADARTVFSKSGIDRPWIGVSCHSVREAELAEGHGADFALFGPVFEKSGTNVSPGGISQLHQVGHRHAAKREMPIIAIGGVTLDNASACLRAGASGIAGIRLFQGKDIVEIVAKLRSMST